MKITKELSRKVLETVDAGLVSGMGAAKPGKMCVEAAVCFALGLPHSDNPPCVGAAVRSFKIRLNDARWSSNAARTKGMRKLAIAQLGSDTIDQRAFADLVIMGTCNRILPIALRAAASRAKEPHKAALLAAIPVCEQAKDCTAAREAALVAKSAADAYAAAYTAYTAAADAYAAACTAYTAAAAYTAYTAADAAYTAAYTAYTAAYAADAAYTAYTDGDEVLNLAEEIGLDALKQLNSPGCEYLYMAEEAT